MPLTRRTLLAVLPALATAAALAGCRDDDVAPPAQRGDPGPLRTDAAPLTDRWPALGTPVAVRWYGGTMGDDRVPGPSTYWIDAVVTLDPGTAAAFPAASELERSPQPPEVVEQLRTSLPPGPWFTGAALSAALGPGPTGPVAFGAVVHLDPATRTLVLRAVGGG